MQGLKKKAYQPGPNSKAGFTEYKAWQFPCAVVQSASKRDLVGVQKHTQHEGLFL